MVKEDKLQPFLIQNVTRNLLTIVKWLELVFLTMSIYVHV